MVTLNELQNQPRKLSSFCVITSGGDAPGMNAAIRSVVRYGISQGCTVYGAQRGYSGLLEKDWFPMELASVANVIQRGGTLLKTDRCQKFFEKKYRKQAADQMRQTGIEGLIVIGGDGSFAGAHLLANETGFPVIGVPGTIDNDIPESEDSIGFDTAVNTALEAIDRIRDTASSHDRLFLVEVMGRNSGFIALRVGVGGGAEKIILPNEKHDVDQICQSIDRGVKRGKSSSILVVAEGPTPGLTTQLAKELERRNYSPRVCILGHTQRGGRPTAHDRYLASGLGAAGTAYLISGHSNHMVGIQKGEVTLIPFSQVIGKKKTVPYDYIQLAEILAT